MGNKILNQNHERARSGAENSRLVYNERRQYLRTLFVLVKFHPFFFKLRISANVY